MGSILSTTGTLSNVCAGTYFVEFNDIGNSCIDIFQVFIASAAALNIVVDNVIDASSCGIADGSINVTTSGPGVLSHDWQDDLKYYCFRRFIKCNCWNILANSFKSKWLFRHNYGDY